MKPYKEYMDKITVPDSLHQKLVSCASGKSPAHTEGKSLSRDTDNSPLPDTVSSSVHSVNMRRSRIAAIRRYAAAFACLAVVLASIYAAPHLLKKADFSARQPSDNQSMLSDKSLTEPFSEPSSESLSITQAGPDQSAGSGETPGVMQHNESPDVSGQGNDPSESDMSVKYITDPDAPDEGSIGINAVSHNDLSLDEARADDDFGAYLPKSVPSGFTFESAFRFTGDESDFLSVLWTKGMSEIHWSVSRLEEKDKARITSVADRENYDLSLYPIPHAESVPEDMREIVDDPIFRIDELTLDAVKARAFEVRDSGDVSGPRMNFSVLYGDTLVKLNVKGASPEEIYDILKEIGVSL